MTYSIIVCDDDPKLATSTADKINIAIQNLKDDDQTYAEIDARVVLVANNFGDVLGYVAEKGLKNGIYFLDIELSKDSNAKNGVDLAEDIKKFDQNAQIIFVTAYDKYAPLTYQRRIGAIDYINKAQSNEEKMQRIEETLRQSIDRINHVTKSNVRNFTYKVGRRIFKVDQESVYYIENSTTQHKVVLVAENGQAEFKGNISQIDSENDWLVKVSQSCVINPENIKSVDKDSREIMFPNDNVAYYSKAFKKIVSELL